MKAMILAAGLGTRLRPLTHRLPKPLINVNGLPLIFYNLALLKKYRIKNVVINLFHLGKQIQDLLGDGKKFGFHFEYSVESKILGTGGGITKAKKYFDKAPFIVLNADIIIDINLKDLIRFHGSQKRAASLVVIPKNKDSEYGSLQIDRFHNVVSILGKPGLISNTQDTFFAGVHLMRPEYFKENKEIKKSCIIQDTYIPWLKRGKKIGGFVYQGYWNDLGTLERLKQTEKMLRENKVLLSYHKYLKEFREILEPQVS